MMIMIIIILGRRDIACGLSRLYLDAASQQCAVSRNRNSVTVAALMIIMIFTVLIKKYDGDTILIIMMMMMMILMR